MKTSTIVLVTLLILVIAGLAYYAGSDNDTDIDLNVDNGPVVDDNIDSTEEIFIERPVEGNKQDLVSFSVQPNQEVPRGMLSFNGSVRNAYFFEANIGINILDEDKNVLKRGNAMATSEWMTTEPVAFSGTIDLTGLPPGPGYIQIANDNASGLPEHDKFIYIPILIGE